MYRLTLITCLALASLSTFDENFIVKAIASDRFQPISTDELKMTREPLAPGAPAIILYRQVDRNDNSPTHEDNYVRIKILKEEGRKYADIEIPFVKSEYEVKNVQARTIRPDGSISIFDGNVIEKSIVKTKGARVLAETLALPDVQIGSIIEYSFTYDLQSQLFNSSWILNSDLFTKHARFSLTKNARWTLLWTWHALPEGTAQPKLERDVVRLEVSNVPAFQNEDYMPPEEELKARVDFTYEGNAVPHTPDLFWKTNGKRWNDYVEGFVAKRKAMEKAVEQSVSPTDPPEVKLRKLYDRVQQMRNTSFEAEKTLQEQRRGRDLPAENVEEVWKRGYGSAFDLSWLYLALVRAAGFEANGCWVSSRRDRFFVPETMQNQQLEYAIVSVKLHGQDSYFDPGDKFAPLGMLYWTVTAVPALCLDRNGGYWVRTPLPESSDSKTTRKASLRLSESGDLEGSVTVTYTGLDAMYYRFEAKDDDDVARRAFMENELRNQIPTVSEATLTNKPDWASSETPFVAEFKVKLPAWASNAGKRKILPIGVFAQSERHMFESANRVHPIYFPYPYSKTDDITIELPSGWSIASLPKSRKVDGKIVNYTLTTGQEQETVHLSRTLNVDILKLDVDYYGSLRDFFQTVRAGDEEEIVLQMGTKAALN